MSSDNNPSSSTFKSYLDQAVGTAQSAIGSITGNNENKEQGENTKKQGKNEHDASHTVTKVGPFTADPNTGAAVKADPGRSSGSWNQTVGAAKESIGNMIGNESLRQEGVRQNAEGKSQEAMGQVQDFGDGITKRVQGALGSVGAAITGDRESEAKWRDIHDEGKTRQRGAEADIQKRQQQPQQSSPKIGDEKD
ncbi:hypothetical protein V8E54_002543 [Elaphomyces granulatus]|jgi:uncharacterized protein YjbJ (UPF0337 family)